MCARDTYTDIFIMRFASAFRNGADMHCFIFELWHWSNLNTYYTVVAKIDFHSKNEKHISIFFESFEISNGFQIWAFQKRKKPNIFPLSPIFEIQTNYKPISQNISVEKKIWVICPNNQKSMRKKTTVRILCANKCMLSRVKTDNIFFQIN